MRTINIAGRLVGEGHPVFIIAEAGVNHNGDLDLALKLVDAAFASGADGIKFQLYRAEEQVCTGSRTAEYQRERTGAKNMLEMAQSYDLPWEAHRTISAHCRHRGIAYMASCFDCRAVDFLIDLGGECIKVASGEITNDPLLAYIAAAGKPILLSTGMSSLQEVAGAVQQIRANGGNHILLLQCTSNYPASPETINLRAMQTMSQAFDVPVGYSDHTVDNTVAVAAVALGASVVEKHFTLDRALPGPDHAMSLEPQKLKDFVESIRNAEAALGSGVKEPHPSEMDVRCVARRSLVSVGTIRAGERLTEDNVTLKRPASGIDPRLWEAVKGRTASCNIPADVTITWEMLA